MTMFGLSTETFARPPSLDDRTDPNVLHARSYLLIRVIVGMIGILLPFVLWGLEASPLLKAGWRVRGSLSAYYHSGARDIFVGALCVTGFLLITYMAGHRRLWDYWLSTIAGVAVLGVALLPTTRPNIDETGACGSVPTPPAGCTPLQQVLGERALGAIHLFSAAVFILSLAALCFVFAKREEKHNSAAHARFDRACGTAILLAVAWVVLGLFVEVKIFGLTHLYVGEVVSVLSFGACWIHKARDLLKTLMPRTRAVAATG